MIFYFWCSSVIKWVSDSVTLRTAACQASLSFTISWTLLRFKSIELVMLSNHHILGHLLLLFPSIFPSTGVFSWYYKSNILQFLKICQFLNIHLQVTSCVLLLDVNSPFLCPLSTFAGVRLCVCAHAHSTHSALCHEPHHSASSEVPSAGVYSVTQL